MGDAISPNNYLMDFNNKLIAEQYAKNHSIFPHEKLDIFLSYVKGPILDIGCGVGEDVAYFRSKGNLAIGIDPSQSMVDLANSVYVKKGSTKTLNEYKGFSAYWLDGVIQFLDPASLLDVLNATDIKTIGFVIPIDYVMNIGDIVHSEEVIINGRSWLFIIVQRV